jgi:type IV secretory pathway protease TraF
VGCGPGSYLETRGKDVYCDGSYLGAAHIDAGNYKKSNQKLGASEVFLIGDNPRSYDSRYFGLVNKDAINAKLIPIF